MAEDPYRARYNESKRRNQETLERMQRLEHEIVRVETEIREKKTRVALLESYHEQCNERIMQQKAYQHVLFEIRHRDEARHKGYGDDHHAIQKLCELLEAHLKHDAYPDDPTRQAIKEFLLSRISNQVLAHLTRQMEALPVNIPTRSRAPPPPPPSFSTDPPSEASNIPHARVSLDELADAQHKQADLEQRIRELSQQVRARVNHFYRDPSIQEALWHSIYTRAESRESAAELNALKMIADGLEASIPDSARTEGGTLKDLVHQVAKKQARVLQLMETNREYAQMIQQEQDKAQNVGSERHQQQLNELETALGMLAGLIRKQVDLFHRLPLRPESFNIIPDSRDSTRLEQIKDALHPYLRPSRSGVVQALGDTLIRVSALARAETTEPNVREPLESLLEDWHDDLKEHGIEIPEPLDNEDSIDGIVQAGNIFKKHIKQQQARFFRQQESDICAQLDRLKGAEKDMKDIHSIVKESDLIKDGTIAFDLAYQDKTFQEWLETAEQQA